MLKTASGEDLGAIGKIKVRDCLDGQRVEFEATLATKVQRFLLSDTKLREGGYSVEMASDVSYLEKNDKRLHLSCDGKRHVVNLTIYKKVERANVATTKGLQREVPKVKEEMRTVRMGPVPGMEDETKPLTYRGGDEAARQVEPRRVRHQVRAVRADARHCTTSQAGRDSDGEV